MTSFRKWVAAAVAVACVAITPAIAEEAGSDVAKLKEEAKAKIGELMKSLKKELQAAMKEGGPVKALDVCKTVAPQISASLSNEGGMSIGRTALKVRNPGNAPDDYERQVLEQFVADLEAGKDPKEVAHAEVVEADGGKVFRFMKAIPTGKLCLNCHGESLKEDVKAALEKLYPEDQATGFKEGELRGAFTVQKKL